MDFTLYWFMFPVSICVATCAMLSGIGGAALFTPIFILVLPLLGPEYPLQSTVAAIGTALLTETFGFTSGFVGYYRKRLIDGAIVRRFLWISVPIAVAGAFLAHFVADGVLIAGYAALVLALAYIHVFVPHDQPGPEVTADPSDPDQRLLIDSSGREYVYRVPTLGPRGIVYTGVGSFLTGMLSVGIGEVIVPQLTKRGVPMPVAVAASVAIVIVTVACASFTLIVQLINAGGWQAVPWNLVVYSIPGVIIGGQIGPRLQGRVSHRTMEHAIGALFFVIAGAMLLVALRKLGVAAL
ncbi:MAG: sulfite exporter TauE/SafE family protein [Pseudomonadota bacterium]